MDFICVVVAPELRRELRVCINERFTLTPRCTCTRPVAWSQDIPDENHIVLPVTGYTMRTTVATLLEECLAEHDIVDSVDPCEQCGEMMRRSVKREYRGSAVVVLGIERPCYVAELQRFSINRVIVEPTTTITIGGRAYTLKAIVCHRGTHVRSGHYVTFCPSAAGWTSYNDGTVTAVRMSGKVRGVQTCPQQMS